MENVIRILTYGGRMTINLDEFLPTSRKNLRQLFKTIDGDVDHSEELLETMEVYCREKRLELLGMLNGYASSASGFKREAEEMEPLIEKLSEHIQKMRAEMQSRALIKVENDRLIQLKKRQKEQFKRAKESREEYRNTKLRADRLEECREVIERRRGCEP